MPIKNEQSIIAKKETFAEFINNPVVKLKIKNVLGKNIEKFKTALITLVAQNPALADCEYYSILTAAFIGHSLNFSPSTQLGQYYLLPFKDKNTGKIKASFVIGYKGYMQLAIRSGQYRKINVIAIKEGELVKYDPLNEILELKMVDDAQQRETANTIGYAANLECLNGFCKLIYWSKQKMERHALTYSKGYAAHKGSTFWERDFDSMACKTMLRVLLSKWGIMNDNIEQALSMDNEDNLERVGGDIINSLTGEVILDRQKQPVNLPTINSSKKNNPYGSDAILQEDANGNILDEKGNPIK